MFQNLIPKQHQQKVNQAMEIAKQMTGSMDQSQIVNKLKESGFNESKIDEIYNSYGNTMLGKTVLGALGYTPQQVRDQAMNLLDGSVKKPINSSVSNLPSMQGHKKSTKTNGKFPRI